MSSPAESRPSGPDDEDVKFPYAVRLELDDALQHLLDRVREVQRSQGRLRGLLRAYRNVTRAVDVEQVLRHVVEAARRLVDARYAALGVVRDGQLVRFLHSGMDADTVAAINHLPDGKGMLGLLVTDPQTLRLADLAQHPSSSGFPEHHPPMRSFLGVPVRVGDRIFGNLYMTDKQGAEEFSDDDEELAAALAGIAGTAIENATLFADNHRRQVWQTLMVDVTTTLLADQDPVRALRRLILHIADATGAAGVAVRVPTADPADWRVAVAEGTLGPWEGTVAPLAGSVAAVAVAQRQLVTIDPATDPRTVVAAAEATDPVGHTVGVPMIGDNEIVGVLIVSRQPGQATFDALSQDLIAGAAAQAGLALKLAAARHAGELLHLADEREKIGTDLQNRIINRLFAHVLAIQGAASRIGDPAVSELLQSQVGEVDAIIRDIRATVFHLRHTP